MLALRQRAQRIDLGTGEIHVARPARRSMQGGNGTFRTGLAFAFVDLEEWCRHHQCLRAALLRQSSDLSIHDPLGGLQCSRRVIPTIGGGGDLASEILEHRSLLIE